MAGKVVNLKLEKRTLINKKNGVKLRRGGLIPVEIYIKGSENIHAQVNAADFIKVVSKNQAGVHAIFEVEIGGKTLHTVIHDFQINPLTDKFMHLDMKPIDMNSKIVNKVSVKLIGDAPAVKKGGILVHDLHEMELEALPADFPPFIEVDVSVLTGFQDTIHIENITFPKGVVTLHESGTLVCHIEAKRGTKDDEEPAEATTTPAATTEQKKTAEKG